MPTARHLVTWRIKLLVALYGLWAYGALGLCGALAVVYTVAFVMWYHVSLLKC